ncbi:MAG: hypothetical protein ABEN55_24150 [Bradymonadaceae bacterium]
MLAVAAGCLGSASNGDSTTDAGEQLLRPTEARRALRRECRHIERRIGSDARSEAAAWRIRRCRTPGCERTIPYNRLIYIRRPDDRRARQEYVHACLFISGKIDGHHDWMGANCRFCYNSPACTSVCR